MVGIVWNLTFSVLIRGFRVRVTDQPSGSEDEDLQWLRDRNMARIGMRSKGDISPTGAVRIGSVPASGQELA